MAEYILQGVVKGIVRNGMKETIKEIWFDLDEETPESRIVELADSHAEILRRTENFKPIRLIKLLKKYESS